MSDIKEQLLSAAEIYYQYLCDNDLGLSQITITSYQCTDSELIMRLKHNVGDMDINLSGALILCINETLYEITQDGEIEPSFYDDKQKILYLHVSPKLSHEIAKMQKGKKSPLLFSDLKFLVKNVFDFFEKYGDNVRLPSHISQNLIPHISRLSDEQNDALHNVLNHPLSYVWGPPGTGKTQAVLFEALLYYIKQGKKVAVIATTNNALEQVLKTLIEQFDALGLDRSNILRLGTPTLRYMQHYPQTCDPSILDSKKEPSLFAFQDTLKNRLKNAFVVGVTLDGYIKRYEPLQLHFAHIFLDECAYAPLIKTCALCIDGTPLSFFGDHKQLSPVCEMPLNELIKVNNQSAFLWNLSALFLESFCQNADISAFIYNKNYDMPPLEHTFVSKLSKTHRYGDNLAILLDKYIYHIGLRGTDSQMELFFIDSGAKSEDDTHISESEVRKCETLCAKLNGQDYALITPFKKQRRMLSRRISSERVFTIHASQGQEFDNVIFSPVSLHYYLTNSQQTNALYAINVALSRAKKRLFIVCDYAFWSRQKGQFIWAILQVCKPFHLA